MDIIVEPIRKKLDFSEFTYMLMEKKQLQSNVRVTEEEMRSGLRNMFPGDQRRLLIP